MNTWFRYVPTAWLRGLLCTLAYILYFAWLVVGAVLTRLYSILQRTIKKAYIKVRLALGLSIL